MKGITIQATGKEALGSDGEKIIDQLEAKLEQIEARLTESQIEYDKLQ